MKRQPGRQRIRSRHCGIRLSRAKTSLRLNRNARSWPVVLATVIALRAFVPVGYMLSLPGDGSLDWALHLCPVQNRSLDLAAVQATAAAEHHDHANSDGDRTHLTVSGECAAWLDSATPPLATSLSVAPAHSPADLSPVEHTAFVTGRLRRHATQPRAPPITA